MRPIINIMVFVLTAAGCDYDDPDDPGDPSGPGVDFLEFDEPGLFSEDFWDVTFQAGELAIDVIGGQSQQGWSLGPGTSLMPGIDDDVAPYPNWSRSRKRTPHNGIWDKRYWVQFAGGRWDDLKIRVEPRAKFRASPATPSFFPFTNYTWCPELRACMSLRTAILRRRVRCYRYGLNGSEISVSAANCIHYHPRMHWRVIPCDDCPLPAGETDDGSFVRDDE